MDRWRRMRMKLGASLLCAAVAVGTSVPQVAAAGTYVVRPHDTLSSIAQAYGTTVGALVAANHLGNPNLITVGQVLVIDQASAPSSLLSYVVQWGDTLSAIAQRFGVTVEALVSANGIGDPSSIRAGQHLAIPGGADNPAAAPTAPAASGAAIPGVAQASFVSGTGYVVQAGDTLSAIAQRYGVTADALAAANNIAVTSLLSVGQQLAVPASSAAGSDAVGAVLAQEAQASGVDASLLKALAWQESGWQMVTAADGGIGVMQLMPDSVTWVSNSLLGSAIDPYNLSDNVRAGATMLRYYLNVFGDVRQALAAYHQGLASVETQGILPDTETYIANILALQQRFAG